MGREIPVTGATGYVASYDQVRGMPFAIEQIVNAALEVFNV